MYYPKSQITTNLYTNGGEFIYVKSKLSYTGYYFAVSSGKYYTGKNISDRPNEELKFINIKDTPINPDYPNDVSTSILVIDPIYSYLKNNIDLNVPIFIPMYSPSVPTENDYQTGEYRRYFCKKVNEIIYVEINKNTYNKLKAKDKGIAWQQYLYFNTPWQLTGDKEKVFKTNRDIVTLTMKSQKLPMFDMYLKEDYTKYYK